MVSRTSFSTLKIAAAIVIAVGIVVGAGIVVGQAPELFGADVATEPEASITFESQEAGGESVEVSSVSLSEGGFVVVTDERNMVVGVSDYLEPGDHENVTVTAVEELDRELYGRLTATAYLDRTDDETFEADREEGTGDRPYIVDGYPVSETATVTAVDRPEDVERSFTVTSLDGPSTGRTSQTAEFVATVENPAENEFRQYAEFRVNGDLYERQVFSLAAGETRNLTFEVDLAEVGNGSHIYGVYTELDGELGRIDVEYDGPAHVEVQNVSSSRVVTEAGVPDGGYVGVTDDNGTILGVSDRLESGVHESVAVDIGNVSAGTNLTVQVYRDDPAGEREPDPYQIEGEPVRATVQVPEAETE